MIVVALVPAFNEAKRIAATVSAISKIQAVNTIVVIDDGSVDSTSDIAMNAGATVIRMPTNCGKGQALNAAWKLYQADIYLVLDADLQESASRAADLLQPLLHHEADMVIAHFAASQVRRKGEKMGFGVAKNLARWGIFRLTGYVAHSPLSGQRALRAEVLGSCGGFAEGFGVEVDLTIEAVRNGFRIVEVDLPMTHRATGWSIAGFGHRGKQLLEVTKVLWQAWRRKQR